MLCVYKPNSVSCPYGQDGSYLSAIVVANDLKRHFALARDTALHRGKDLAVAPERITRPVTPLRAPDTLSNIGVTVRTSWIAPDGGYPLPVFSRKTRGTVFGLSSKRQ